jgi:hypothetical protein
MTASEPAPPGDPDPASPRGSDDDPHHRDDRAPGPRRAGRRRRDLLLGDGEVTPEEQTCVEDRLGDRVLRSWFVDEILGAATVDDLLHDLATCFA